MDGVLRCFTDGAAKGNSPNASAGWGFYIPKLNVRKSGHIIGTNNVAELTAVKELYKYILTLSDPLHQNFEKPYDLPEITVFSDSRYVIGAMTGNKISANKELINEIFELAIISINIVKFYI